MKKVIAVCGPTAVGKTRMGVSLAEALHGEVISGDSMQIYRTMDIGTAKVTEEEMQGIIHHMIDIKNPDETFSVSEFQKEVRHYIDTIDMPIVVGGTGLYIKGALYDYTFEETESKHDEIKAKYAHYTNEELHQYLASFDPQSALDLHPNNRQRVLRAIEIYEESGKRKSDILEAQEHKPVYDIYFVGLTLPRPILYERINKRVDLMIEQGLEEEVKKIYDSGLSRNAQSMKAIGYKEWFDYFEGSKTKEQVIEEIKKHSRNYAKRQYTWFNNQFDVHWYDVNLEDFDSTIHQVLKDIEEWYEKRLFSLTRLIIFEFSDICGSSVFKNSLIVFS